jgi:hypothetical protein
LHNPANWNQGPVSKEIFQTLLTNTKQVNVVYHSANIIQPTQTRINRKKYTFYITKLLEHQKKFKTGPVLYLGLEPTMRQHPKLKKYSIL